MDALHADYFRDQDGWRGQTEFEAGNQRGVRITTGKRRAGHGLATNVTCHTREANGLLTHRMSFGTPGADDSKTVAVSQPRRVTESVVRQQHTVVLARIDEIRGQVARFYAAEPQAQEVALPASEL